MFFDKFYIWLWQFISQFIFNFLYFFICRLFSNILFKRIIIVIPEITPVKVFKGFHRLFSFQLVICFLMVFISIFISLFQFVNRNWNKNQFILSLFQFHNNCNLKTPTKFPQPEFIFTQYHLFSLHSYILALHILYSLHP